MKTCLATLLTLAVLCPAAAQAADTLNDVWMRDGGARLYYDALVRPLQLNMNGARWEDPALNHRLPPLHGPQPRKRAVTPRPVAPAPGATTGVGTPPPQTGARLTPPTTSTAPGQASAAPAPSPAPAVSASPPAPQSSAASALPAATPAPAPPASSLSTITLPAPSPLPLGR